MEQGPLYPQQIPHWACSLQIMLSWGLCCHLLAFLIHPLPSLPQREEFSDYLYWRVQPPITIGWVGWRDLPVHDVLCLELADSACYGRRMPA